MMRVDGNGSDWSLPPRPILNRLTLQPEVQCMLVD